MCKWNRNGRDKETLCVCVVDWLASLCLCHCWELWVLSEQRGPPPSSWTPSGISPSSNEVFSTPIVIMQNLSSIPEAQRNKACIGLTAASPSPSPFSVLSLLFIDLTDGGTITALWMLITDGGSCPYSWSKTFSLMCWLDLWFYASVHVRTPPLKPAVKIEMSLWPPGGLKRKIHILGEHPTNWRWKRSRFTDGGSRGFFSTRNWFQYRMMMSLISNYVFTEILQSLLVCQLFLVIHRCLTLRVRVCACVTERDVTIQWENTHIQSHHHLHSWDSGRIISGLPNYYSPSSSCLLTVVLFIALPVVW